MDYHQSLLFFYSFPVCKIKIDCYKELEISISLYSINESQFMYEYLSVHFNILLGKNRRLNGKVLKFKKIGTWLKNWWDKWLRHKKKLLELNIFKISAFIYFYKYYQTIVIYNHYLFVLFSSNFIPVGHFICSVFKNYYYLSID